MIEEDTLQAILKGLPSGSRLSCRFYQAETYQRYQGQLDCFTAVILPADAFYNDAFSEILSSAGHRPYRLLAACPPINKGHARQLFLQNLNRLRACCDGLLLGNLGDLVWSDGWKQIQGDYSFNCYNRQTAQAWMDLLGRDAARETSVLTISPELPWEEQAQLARHMPSGLVPEILVYGRLAVMRMEHCVVAAQQAKENKHTPAVSCGGCQRDKTFLLRDERGREFPGLCLPDGCQNLLFSHRPVCFLQESGAKKTMVDWAKAGYQLRIDLYA